MPRITNILVCFTATALAAATAAIAGTATAADGVPAVGGMTGSTGCSISCISAAVVTRTSTSASVKVTTTVPTSTTVSVSKLDAQLGLAAGNQPKHIVVAAFVTVRTVLFAGLEPETSYRIAVTARDLAGKTDTRTGTFKTRPVKVAVGLPGVGLSAGVGCKADCIERGTAKAHGTQVGRVDFDVRLTEPGRIELDLYRSNGNGSLVLQRTITSSNGVEKMTTAVRGLMTGTKYTVRLKATDGRGQSRIEWGSFRTASARAIVIFHKIHVIGDGEVGRGEIYFGYYAESLSIGGNGFHKIGSGDTVAAVAWGTSRETVTIATSIDGHVNLDLAVRGVECDNVLMKNCVVEASHESSGEYAGDTYVMARAAFDLETLIDPNSELPSAFGTGLPAGHDAYLIWENTSYGLKFQVFATVDFEVVP